MAQKVFCEVDSRQVGLREVSVICQALFTSHGVCNLLALIIQPGLLSDVIFPTLFYKIYLQALSFENETKDLCRLSLGLAEALYISEYLIW